MRQSDHTIYVVTLCIAWIDGTVQPGSVVDWLQ
jgi:hypothetical protein